MGDTFSADKQSNFLQKIDLFQAAEDPNYGKFQVYRLKDPPYEYILDHRKTFIEDQDRMTAYLTQAAKLKTIEHKNLAKVHAVVMREDKQLCIIHRVVHLYCSYYNFTLSMAIAKKKLTKNSFSQGDLLYLLHSMLDAVVTLRRNGFIFGTFRTDSIYLSPEGHLKLYLLDMDPEGRHGAFHRVLAEQAKLPEYILSPEQLSSIRKMEYQGRYSPYKAQVFAIGMVMLELVTLDSARFYYNEQRMELMLSKALFALDLHKAAYSEEFMQLVKSCLSGEAKDRPEPEDLLQRVEEVRAGVGRTLVYCIRLQAEENKERKEQPPVVAKPKGQYILNSLAKKLNPSPISTISSSSASLFRSGEAKSASFRGREQIGKFSNE